MVVVVGGTHHNTLSIIRCLGESNLNPDLILCDSNGKRSYVLRSKYVSGYHIVSNANEAAKILHQFYENAVVIICSDDVAALLNSNYAYNMNKQRQVELARKKGFIVPVSIDVKVGEYRGDFNIFPCLVKPLSSYLGGKKIDICDNNNQLLQVLSNYQIDVIQIQQFIKKDYEIVIDGLAIGNEVLIPGYIRKHRDVNGGTSFSTVYPIESLSNEIVQLVRNLVQEINYEGLFGVELIFSEGKYFFIEINLRNDATTYAIKKAGVNLPLIYVLYKQNASYCEEIKNKLKVINAIVEKRDLTFVFSGKLGFRQWLKDFRSSECRYFYSKEDKGPFMAMLQFYLNAPLRKIKRLIKA